METLYLVMMFIAPGLIGRGLRDSFNKERRRYDNIYDYLFQIVIDSILVNGVTLIAMNQFVARCSNVNELTLALQDFTTLAKYIVIMMITTLLWSALKYTKVLKGYTWIRNKILRIKDYKEYSIHTTVWDNLINEERLKGTWLVVSVYRDEKYVVSGMMTQNTSTNGDVFEMALEYTKEVEDLKNTNPELFKVEQEYYNTDTGLRVVFYKQDVINEHWPK